MKTPITGCTIASWDYNVGEAKYGKAQYQGALNLHESIEGGGAWSEIAGKDWQSLGLKPDNELTAAPIKPSFNLESARTFEAAQEKFSKAIGGDTGFFIDPSGQQVVIGLALFEHLADKDGNLNSMLARSKYFDLIPEVVQSPNEVWSSFSVNSKTGRCAMRRRYIKIFESGKKVSTAMVFDVVKGVCTALTFIPSTKLSLGKIRKGFLIYSDNE